MNTLAYIDISTQLRNALAEAYPDLEIDIYNGQYEDPEKFANYNYPAVFVEFSPNNWLATNIGAYEGPGGFRIHVVVPLVDQDTRNIDQAEPDDQATRLAMMNFPELVHQALCPPSPNRFIPRGFTTPLELTDDMPDHNYDQKYVMIYHYTAEALDETTGYYKDGNWVKKKLTDVTVVPTV